MCVCLESKSVQLEVGLGSHVPVYYDVVSRLRAVAGPSTAGASANLPVGPKPAGGHWPPQAREEFKRAFDFLTTGEW